MKTLVFLMITVMLALIMTTVTANNQSSDENYMIKVRDVEIVDSQLMDQVLLHVTSDSVRELLNKYFIKSDLSEFQKEPKGITVFTDKRIFYSPYPIDSTIQNLLVDDIKDIVNNDTLDKVVICFCPYISNEFVTTYKGRKFYFIDMQYYDGKPIFKAKSTYHSRPFDSEKVLSSLLNNVYVPLIYHNGKLYIDPHTIQWRLEYE